MESAIHWSHSLVAFRHSSDERNPPDVTGRPVPVCRRVGGKVSIETEMVSIPVQLHLNIYSKDSNHLGEGVPHESRDQTIQLSLVDKPKTETVLS